MEVSSRPWETKTEAESTGSADERPTGLSSIDLTILVSPDISVRESHDIESRVRERIMSERRDAREVKIHIHGVEPGEMEEIKKEKEMGGSDFGRDGC